MDGYIRDALLGAASGGALLTVLALVDATAWLGDVPTAVVGVGAALAVEALFIADTPAGKLWERPGVQAASVAVLVGGGTVAAVTFGPRVVAAACWGLATYFVLLGLALAGLWPVDE